MEHNQLDPNNIYSHTEVAEAPNDGNAIFKPTPNVTDTSDNRPVPTKLAAPPCDTIVIDYEIAPAVICAVCFVFGILYCFFGYRFFKATMFMTGFIFGALVTYLICLEENLLPLEGKIGVAIAAGILCGLITMLVQYVGLFMTGFHLGLLLGVAALCIMEQFYHPSTKWICIGILFGGGLIFALLTLYFQKCMTILGTSIFGSALIVTGLDYFIELFMMVHYVWDRIKAEWSDPICWFSWIILGLWPATFLVGTLAQWKVTGRGVEHKESPRPPKTVVQNKRQQKVDLQRARERDRRDSQHSRYRHLYQVRRVNGDVVSQSYISNIHNKLSPALQNIAGVSDEHEEGPHTSLTQVNQVPC